jgi:hypothetical protein
MSNGDPRRSQERRKERREKTLIGATVSFNARRSVFDCLIRNISTAGALLEFPDTTLAPTEFELHVRHRDQSFRGTVVWRKQERAGVALAAFQFAERAVSLDDVRRQKALKRENRALRKQLDYMT